MNTTDYFSKVLYSGGDDVTYSSVQDFIQALTDGSFALGMLPTQQFVQVALCMTHASSRINMLHTHWHSVPVMLQ